MKVLMIILLQVRLWFRWLFNQLGLRYDAELWVIPPPPSSPVAAAERKRRPSREADTQDDLVRTPFGLFHHSESADGTVIEEDRVLTRNPRNPVLTPADEEALMMSGIDLTSDKVLAKAAEIKRLWAYMSTDGTYMTNRQISEHFGNKKGYKLRSIEGFTSVFAKVPQSTAEVA